MSGRRPRYLGMVARLLLSPKDREFLIGDLDELYLRNLARRGRLQADARYVRDLLASVMARELGGVLRGSEQGRPRSVMSRASSGVVDDARHALRSLRAQPRYALIVIVTLALGAGPATAVFSMVNQLILRPLPGAPNTATAAYLQLSKGGRTEAITFADFDDLRRQAFFLNGMASYGKTGHNVALDAGRPVQAVGSWIYGDYFEILGVEPSFGRLLTAADTELDANPDVVVISESLRSRLFGADTAVVGRSIRLDGRSVEVMGVAADGFQGVDRGEIAGIERGEIDDLWVPFPALRTLFGVPPDMLRGRMAADLLVRPNGGVSGGDVERQVSDVLARLSASSPVRESDLSGLTPTIYEGLHTSPEARESTNRMLRMMSWAVAIMLAISCANVAALLLFRNLTRRGALATLRALGASTARLARQHLVESLLLGLVGSAVGIGLAWMITLPFRGERLSGMPPFEDFALEPATMAFVGLLSVLTALLFGAVPAILAGQFDLGAALRASRARQTGRVGPLRTALTAGQVALTLALTVGAFLMVRTISNMRAVDTGLDMQGVVGVSVVNLSRAPPEQIHTFQRALLQATRAIPGVESAALDVHGPHGTRLLTRIGLPGAPIPTENDLETRAVLWPVTPGWFDVFRVDAIHGRIFEDDDWRSPSPRGAVITASLARRLFGRTDVAGRQIMVRETLPQGHTILGVVGDYVSLTAPTDATDAIFIVYGESFQLTMSLLVRVAPGATDVVARVQAVMEAHFPDTPVATPVPLSGRVDYVLREQRMLGRLLWMLSVFGVLMSAVGLYGAISFVVSSRKREFGIRLALGADAARIVRLVARSAIAIVVIGTGLGVLVAYPVSRLLRSWLVGIGTLDIASYAGAALLLAATAVIACLAPARTALRADPIATLREE